MRVLLEKVKEVLFSVLPITGIVLLLHFTVTPLPTTLLMRFLIGAAVITLGLSIFLFGIDIGISPLGHHIGTALSKSNRVWVLVAVGLVLGFFISVAEPDLQILAAKVGLVTGDLIPSATILVVVSVGIAVMLVVGILRIVYNVPLYVLLAVLYGVILLLAYFVPPEILAISFDASGATTGALTVPFILALALGVTAMKKDSKASENDSFGLVAVTSTGAILSVLLMSVITKIPSLTGQLPQDTINETEIFMPFLRQIGQMAMESLLALLPIVAVFIVGQLFVFKLKAKPFRKVLKGFLYTLLGLVLFLTGVNAGFMDVGIRVGYALARLEKPALMIAVGFVIGMVTILAEPAVHVLTDQIELVTSGYIKRRITLSALALGVGAAVALSVVRILVPSLQLWHYLLPGYIVSIALSFFVPKLYVGIAFDAGGVASGPMTATFILALMQGIADCIPAADVLRDSFGMIALVAMTPIITLQILGLVVKIKSRRVKHHG